MKNPDIIFIEDPADPLIESVKEQFIEMYEHMGSLGLILPLAADGADKWMNGVLMALNKFGCLAVATSDGNLAGFAHGALRFTPDYLGAHKVGVITHIFVTPEARKQKIAAHLLTKLENWFLEKQAHSIELQVLSGNAEAIKFWEASGYLDELRQYRKSL